MDDFLKHFRSKQLEKSQETLLPTQCPYCSVQCSMTLIEEAFMTTKQYKAKPNKQDTTSGGRMCIKGANAHQHVYHKERITSPLLKIDGEFVPISWELAIEYIAERFHSIQTHDGNDAIGVYGGGSLTNEEAYLLGKFARVALKTKHIDYNGRFCMSAAAAASNAAFGLDRGLTNSLSDIPDTNVIILAGTNIADCQPTIVPYFRQAKKNGAYIIVIDPRETATAKLADLHLKVRPGTDSVLANGLLKVIKQEGYIDDTFIKSRTKGFENLDTHLDSFTLDDVSSITGVPTKDIIEAGRQYGIAKDGFIFTARGVEQHANGSDTVKQFINLVLATGKIGRHASGFGSITGQGNGQGGREHGQKADQLPGYRSIENDLDRKIIASIWDIDEKNLPRKGVSAYEMIEKMMDEDITALFIMGSNPIVSNPNAILAKKALQKLNFLVVVDMFISETAELADLILPSSSYLEDEGTMTNLEGKVTLRKGERPPPKDVKHDWEILCLLAKALNKENGFEFTSPKQIFDELRLASRGSKADYFGISYERLSHEALAWPCPHQEHSGTPRLFETRFAHSDGKAIFSPLGRIPDGCGVPPEYPLLLTTGRVMAHYLTGVQTRRSPDLLKKSPEPLVEMHPETAARYHIQDDELIHLYSIQGSVVMRACLTNKIRKDTLFAPFHWGGSQAINRLVAPFLDPVCHMPAFKLTYAGMKPITEKIESQDTGGLNYETVDQGSSERKEKSTRLNV
ncbi:molybdopterin-dependent oxidoreductase [Bacillus sp. A116_S68]|nr:molybdopterin-dependent oxidoreductase [Bacillus sp. A116_S68]